MMRSVGIAMLLMTVATVAAHLGLPQAIAGVVMRVCKCHKCLSFWLTLIGLTIIGCPLDIAALLSVVSAYMSNWLAMLLNVIFKLYTRLWERVERK